MRCRHPIFNMQEATTMSMSKSRKAREKLARQGRVSPDLLRGSWQGINPATRRTETLREKQAKLQSKHKRNHAYYSDDSFYFGDARLMPTRAI